MEMGLLVSFDAAICMNMFDKKSNHAKGRTVTRNLSQIKITKWSRWFHISYTILYGQGWLFAFAMAFYMIYLLFIQFYCSASLAFSHSIFCHTNEKKKQNGMRMTLQPYHFLFGFFFLIPSFKSSKFGYFTASFHFNILYLYT